MRANDNGGFQGDLVVERESSLPADPPGNKVVDDLHPKHEGDGDAFLENHQPVLHHMRAAIL